MCASNAYHMHMNESTGRKMGPREKNLREGGCAHEYCSDLKIARIADALEEALSDLDIACGHVQDPDVTGALHERGVKIRAVLAEVDRG